MFAISRVTQRLNDKRIDEIGSIDAGNAFVYLYRRFGPPFAGSDSYKDVCAYYIDTSLEDVQVVVRIGGDRAYLGVAAGMKVQWRYNEDRIRNGDEDTLFMKLAGEALESGIRDLLRPVYVRDVPITLLGRATESELGEYLEDEEQYENEVPRSKMAGYGIPHDLYEYPELFFEFVMLLREWGGGDIGKGMELVMEWQSNST